FSRHGVSVEVLGMHKRRPRKYFWHAGNLAPGNLRLKKGHGKRNAEDCDEDNRTIKVTTKTVSACPSPPRQSAGNPPYCLPKHPLLMYISAVSLPTKVFEDQVASDKPRTLILPSATMRKIPGALGKRHFVCSFWWS